VGVKVSVAYSRNKLALRTRLRNLNLAYKATNLNLRYHFCIFDSFPDVHVHIFDLMKFVGVKVGVTNAHRY